MKPFEEIDRHVSREGKVLRFMHRDGDYWILIDDEELMATRATHSERELARRTCSDLGVPRPRVLIGGLGLGFTLRAALDVLPAAAQVVVAEVFECVVRWNYRHLADLQGDALRDPRLVVARCDVWNALGGSLGDGAGVPEEIRRRQRERFRDQTGADSAFDVVLLDVDNGPAATCLDANARLYGRRGIERIAAALRPGGLLAVWATDPDSGFVKRLRAAGFEAGSEVVRSRGSRGTRHHLFLARSPAAGSAPPPGRKPRSATGDGRRRGRRGA
ncbi:MAG: spermidine synthase [Acidobacteria bacterium]|nr:MAG: spermidine synthase [Acidobacteriota bacterium]REK03848.1 MAG: spermidine synthase [Acidobacteriota bacterium]